MKCYINPAMLIGRAPASFASRQGHLEVLYYLCSFVAEKNPALLKGRAPTSFVHSRDISKCYMIQAILDGRAPASFASQLGHLEVERLPSGSGADIVAGGL